MLPEVGGYEPLPWGVGRAAREEEQAIDSTKAHHTRERIPRAVIKDYYRKFMKREEQDGGKFQRIMKKNGDGEANYQRIMKREGKEGTKYSRIMKTDDDERDYFQ